MLVIECTQGDETWNHARMGIPTASSFHRIITPAKLTSSAQAEDYMNELLTEWLLGAKSEWAGNFWTDRGTALEPMARAWYQFERDTDVTEVGFVYRDEAREVGCSPDGFTMDATRGLELKCPKPSTHLGYLRAGKLPSEYRLQVQGSMWVTGLASWDFLSYHPDLPPLLVRCEPDEEVFATLDEHVAAFIERLADAKKDLRLRGILPLAERAAEPLPF